MSDALLVLNAGSSSLKYSVFLDEDPPTLLARGHIEGRPRDPLESLLTSERKDILARHRIVAVGHRIVHGGLRFSQPVLIDKTVITELEALVPLAPLHQPHNLAAVRAVAERAPAVPQVACFDTGFHRSQPDVAQRFALPRRCADEGIRRYGFHGLSYEYIASVLPKADPDAAVGRTVVAHLGNGASLCAMRNGRSVATTMGFTALDGLVMGTRCGAIDPGVLLYLLDHDGMSRETLQQLLYEQSGLLGVSGLSSDMRVLLSSTDPRAAEAIDLFVYRIGRELGSLAAALGGLDAVVFTGGIGENAASIRSRISHDAQWLGLHLDEHANANGARRISQTGSQVSAWVIPTDEELMIALHTRRVLASTLSPTHGSNSDAQH
jgi:acetate kinase